MPTMLRLVFFIFVFTACFEALAGNESAESSDSSRLELQSPPPATVNSVAISHDGSYIATASDEGGVRIYDAKTGTLLRALAQAGDRCVVFSPDGRYVAAAGFHMDKLVGVFEVQTGRRVQQLAGHAEVETYAVAFSPDGKLLASAGRGDEQALIWDLATGKLRHRLQQPGHQPSCLAFSPDSLTLASGGGDTTIRLWNMQSGRAERTFKGHQDWVCSLDFSKDGKTLFSASCDWAHHRGRDPARFETQPRKVESEWKQWDVASGESQRTVAEPGRILSLTVSPDGTMLACGLGNEVRAYNLQKIGSGRVLTSHDALVTDVAFTPDSAAVLSSSHDHAVVATNVSDATTRFRLPGLRGQVNSIAVSPDGKLLVAGGCDERFAKRLLKADATGLEPGAVRIWNAKTGQLLRRLGHSAEQIMSVAVSPDSQHVASGGAGRDGMGVVRLWDANTGEQLWLATDHGAEVLGIAFAPDGSKLATACADGSVRLFDAKAGGLARSMAGHEGGATSVAFSPNGERLACGAGHGGVRIWETQTGRLVRACKSEDSQAASIAVDRLITSVLFTPDGQTVGECTASIGNTYSEPLRFWDLATGKPRVNVNDSRFGRGRPVVLSPDGTILAAGGKGVQLWDARSGEKTQRLTGILKKVQSIAFSQDGRTLFAGGSYGTINAWEVASGRLLVTLFTFADNRNETGQDDWLAYGADGFYDGSPGADRYVAWRVGDELQTSDGHRRRPDQIKAILSLESTKSAAP